MMENIFDSQVSLLRGTLQKCERSYNQLNTRENTGPRINVDLKTSRSFLNCFLLGLRHFRGFNAGY